jgi:hypothetical protein
MLKRIIGALFPNLRLSQVDQTPAKQAGSVTAGECDIIFRADGIHLVTSLYPLRQARFRQSSLIAAIFLIIIHPRRAMIE